ncbi:MAG: caspase family protein [Candidatus Nezhaarchaeota archaeon]|nr:caspase family protein [Candidatus Nezhaarchaeota archaeon]
MKKAFSLGAVLMLLLLTTIYLAPLAYAASSQAADVEIAPKISTKGPKAQGKPLKQAATGVLGAPLGEGAQKWAVVVGISDYAGTENDIKYAHNDALDMLNALIDTYQFPRGNVRLLISDYSVNNATRADIINAIEWLKGCASEGDEVVFFYSGHGARGKANDGDKELVDEAIVPYECSATSLIWDGELARMFSQIKASRMVFIFDSCYAGGMTDLKANNRVIVMACSENGLAYEYENLQNGQFTYYFVDQGIIMGRADVYDHVMGQSDVTVEEAFDYAKANCVYQTPVISDSFTNDLLL